MQYNNKNVGKAIRKARIEKGLSQEVLSGLAVIARSHLSMIETGYKQANFETIWKIATALEMLPSELVKAIENESEE